MAESNRNPLRILIANEDPDRLAELAAIVRGLGHETVAMESTLSTVATRSSLQHSDVALVALDGNPARALEVISQIVAEAECPVIALLGTGDAAFISEAAKRGIFAYIADADPASLENAIEIVLLRFAEYHGLEGAFGRRAITERAKGILMERHGIDERQAFSLLRDHARRNNMKLVLVAQELVNGSRVLRLD